jgi:hypothetical protein
MTTRSATDPQHLDTEVVAPGGWQRHATLRDGTAVLLRQIRPEDRDRLAAGLRELSPESRYLRFHEDLTEFTPDSSRTSPRSTTSTTRRSWRSTSTDRTTRDRGGPLHP